MKTRHDSPDRYTCYLRDIAIAEFLQLAEDGRLP
jgi:hypothetical protein